MRALSAVSVSEAPRKLPRGAGRPFGSPGHDPSELGRLGGIASGKARRVGKRRKVEDRILESASGVGLATLLREMVRREAEEERRARKLEHDTEQADETLCRLIDEADAERDTIAKLRIQVAELEQQRSELRRQVRTPKGLAELLREVPQKQLEDALVELGMFEVVDE